MIYNVQSTAICESRLRQELGLLRACICFVEAPVQLFISGATGSPSGAKNRSRPAENSCSSRLPGESFRLCALSELRIKINLRSILYVIWLDVLQYQFFRTTTEKAASLQSQPLRHSKLYSHLTSWRTLKFEQSETLREQRILQ